MLKKRQVQIMGSSFYPGAGTFIARMIPGQPLLVERDPDNQFDTNAVKVSIFSKQGAKQQLGHFPRGFAAEVAPLMDAGNELKAFKSRDPKFKGVGIIVVEWEDGTTENDDPTA